MFCLEDHMTRFVPVPYPEWVLLPDRPLVRYQVALVLYLQCFQMPACALPDQGLLPQQIVMGNFKERD